MTDLFEEEGNFLFLQIELSYFGVKSFYFGAKIFLLREESLVLFVERVEFGLEGEEEGVVVVGELREEELLLGEKLEGGV